MPSSCKKWKGVEKIVGNFAGSIIHLLGQLTDSNVQTYVLKHLLAFVPYMAALPKAAPKYLRALLALWTEAQESPRILAFLNIHKLAITTPYPFVHRCMKETYLTFVKNSKFTNVNSLGTINFLINGVIELYKLDPVGAYQHAFVYIRQLAVHLRTALSDKSKDSYRKPSLSLSPKYIHIYCG